MFVTHFSSVFGLENKQLRQILPALVTSNLVSKADARSPFLGVQLLDEATACHTPHPLRWQLLDSERTGCLLGVIDDSGQESRLVISHFHFLF